MSPIKPMRASDYRYGAIGSLFEVWKRLYPTQKKRKIVIRVDGSVAKAAKASESAEAAETVFSFDVAAPLIS